jgi:hypothetical protein
MAKKERKGREQFPQWYQQWTAMYRRCYNKKNKDYPKFGAKGITVCREWSPQEEDGYLNYVNWILSQPNHALLEKGWVVSRIDTAKEYSPLNCDIVTRQVSTQRRQSVKFTARHVIRARRLVKRDLSITLKSLAARFGFGTEAAWSRALTGVQWNNVDCIEAPLDIRELRRLEKTTEPTIDQHELACV